MQFIVYDPHYDPANAKPPTPQLMADMGKFVAEAIQSGALVTTGGLHNVATRLKLKDGKFTVTEGPYIELKELMGGWAVIRAKSLDDAIEWCKRFRNIVGEGESEIVQIFGPEN